jgi:ABC-type multidrug transport system ATPase subunit
MARQNKSALGKQVLTLVNKNLSLLLRHHINTTIYTALLLPILLTVYIGIGQRLNQPQSKYGFADPLEIRAFDDALKSASSWHKDVVFVHNGHTGGEIERVIGDLRSQVEAAGKTAHVEESEDRLRSICRSSFKMSSSCYGAVVFESSPTEGDGRRWSYIMRGDGALEQEYKVQNNDNPAQIYALPFQRAIDTAIIRANSSNTNDVPDLGNTREFAFTSIDDKEREADGRRRYQRTLIDVLGAIFALALIGTAYRMPGHMATERETGLAQLIDSMMPTKYDWEAQLARILSWLYSYTIVYLPGWIVAAVISGVMVWSKTNLGIVIVTFLLAGLALTSQALLGGTPFKEAELSGIVNSVVFMLLAALAQALPNPSTAAVAVLSILFTPCNFVFFIKAMARFEAEGQGMQLVGTPPDSNSSMPGFLTWIFFIIQILVYPLIAAFLERAFHSVAADGRKVYRGDGAAPEHAVQINGMTKEYSPGFFRRLFSFISKPRPATVAVRNLSLSAKRGQILALLGANGSGKSTTLDAIAGLHRFDSGSLSIDASGGIGIAPQKNVLWEEMTVMEHIKFFNKLKSPFAPASDAELNDLIASIGLSMKAHTKSKHLSGGQKRKLQLGLMLTGGSSLCCVDEVSSGIDPLSRRKIWDILLAERGRRTIIMTTHFLDEADLLADNIAILSKGELRAEGSSAALKDALGAGYRVHVLNAKHVRSPPSIPGVDCNVTSTNIVYTAPSSELAAEVIRALESSGLEYRLTSPTIEDVFLHVSDEVKAEENLALSDEPSSHSRSHRPSNSVSSDHMSQEKAMLNRDGSPQLLSGKPAGFFKQVAVLVNKRFTLFKSNWFPIIVAFVIPIVAAAALQSMLKDITEVNSCTPVNGNTGETKARYGDFVTHANLSVGPSSEYGNGFDANTEFRDILPVNGQGQSNADDMHFLTSDTFDDLRKLVEDSRAQINPGGWWIDTSGDAATVIYRVNSDNPSMQSMSASIATLNLVNNLRSDVPISVTFLPFDSPGQSGDFGKLLQVAIFFTVLSGVATCFFSLYPNVERRANVRGLQYSSGVRSLPQWLSHLVFDYSWFMVALIVAAIIFAVSSKAWYNVVYLFPIFLLYGICGILLSYIFSLFMHNQLAAWGGMSAFNVVGFAIYIIAWFYIITFSPVDVVDRNVLIAHYVISAIFPVGSLFRALVVGLNFNSSACDGDVLYSYPGNINAFGAPILYLSIQAIILFSILLYQDSGNKLPSFMTPKPKSSIVDTETAYDSNPQGNTGSGLQVKNLTKRFGNHTAVDDVSFNVKHGEVYALLGPNGAGKSTIMGMIRGDIQSAGKGDVFIEDVSVRAQRALARSNLGVCPQFDAIDNMTVIEHLRHYARLRGISDVDRQVRAVLHAVGLERFKNTNAHHLSGGNKRKLSLGIALTGNPTVIILDEPSSGLDAAAKRVMWRTLETIVPGRSILLTTHSMEEADALAGRAGIVAQRMLAAGTVDWLREQFGDSLYVHLVQKTAPHSSPEEMERVESWVKTTFPSAKLESETYHGQVRFSVPASAVRELAAAQGTRYPGSRSDGSPIGQLIVMLEEAKGHLGIEHHSVSPTTLNEVFLSIVGQHDVVEEGYSASNQQQGKTRWERTRKVLVGF